MCGGGEYAGEQGEGGYGGGNGCRKLEGVLRASEGCESAQQNQTQKDSNERLFILTRTQYAHFRGNPLCQTTKRHLNNR